MAQFISNFADFDSAQSADFVEQVGVLSLSKHAELECEPLLNFCKDRKKEAPQLMQTVGL